MAGGTQVTGVNNSTGAVTSLSLLVSPFTTRRFAGWRNDSDDGRLVRVGLTCILHMDGGKHAYAASHRAAGLERRFGRPRVSCAAGTVTLASLVVTNGIVTHC